MGNEFFRFTDSSFEDFVRTLAVEVFGPGVTAFGDGPDGGREATFSGRVPYPYPSEQCWDGYGIIQAKCKAKPESTKADQAWVLQRLREELDAFTISENRSRKPEYYIFVTNVELSSASKRGGRDRADALIEKYYGRLPLKGHAIWDANQLRTFLNKFPNCRRTFSQFLTAGDVLAKILDQYEASQDRQPSNASSTDQLPRGTFAIDLVTETQVGVSAMQQKVIGGRIEEIQAQLRQFFCQIGRDISP